MSSSFEHTPSRHNSFERSGSHFNLCSALGRRSRNLFVRAVSFIIDGLSWEYSSQKVNHLVWFLVIFQYRHSHNGGRRIKISIVLYAEWLPAVCVHVRVFTDVCEDKWHELRLQNCGLYEGNKTDGTTRRSPCSEFPNLCIYNSERLKSFRHS